MRILLLGKDGQMGTALQSKIAAFGDVFSCNRSVCDIGNFAQLRNVIRQVQPKIIISCAAYTAVDKAELESGTCYRLNAEAPLIMAEQARQVGAWFIHYSTDYVFDGQKDSPYLESDPAYPLNVYGRAKLAADESIASCMQDYTILRIGWVYGLTANNFVKSILRLASERNELEVVADQVGTPTPASLISDVTCELIKGYLLPTSKEQNKARGLFNVAAAGSASRFEYAIEIVREARRQNWPIQLLEQNIIPTKTEHSSVGATRPKYSVLNTDKICELLGYRFPEWRSPIKEFICELGAI